MDDAPDHFLRLPTEIKHHLFNCLQPKELYSSTQLVCKDWRSILTSSNFCNPYSNLLHAKLSHVKEALSSAQGDEMLMAIVFSELEGQTQETIRQLWHILRFCPEVLPLPPPPLGAKLRTEGTFRRPAIFYQDYKLPNTVPSGNISCMKCSTTN